MKLSEQRLQFTNKSFTLVKIIPPGESNSHHQTLQMEWQMMINPMKDMWSIEISLSHYEFVISSIERPKKTKINT